jgi:hypothetical protein
MNGSIDVPECVANAILKSHQKYGTESSNGVAYNAVELVVS